MWKIYIVTLYLLILSIQDIVKREVSTILLILGSGISIIYGLYGFSVERYFIGEFTLGLIPGMILLLIAFTTGQMGYGDGWLLLILGLLLGQRECNLVFTISIFLAGFFALCWMALKRGNPKTKIPYIPFVMVSFILLQWI